MSNTADQIQQQFVAYLGRPATLAELDHWTGRAGQAGLDATLGELDTQLIGSSEFQGLFFAIGDEAVIDRVYVNLFGTPPSAAEKSLHYNWMWGGYDASPTVVLQKALANATPAEQAALADRVAAAQAFTANLPALDDSAHIFGRHFLDGVHDDASLAAALAQVHGALLGGAGNDALTGAAGPDLLFGGAGNDTLVGSEGDDFFAPGTGVDVVNGGAGDDTAQVLGNINDYVRTHPHGADTVLVNAATGENVTLQGVEHVVFRDGVLDDAALHLDGRILLGTMYDDIFEVTGPTDKILEPADSPYTDDTVHINFSAPGTWVMPDNIERAVITSPADVAVTLVANAHGGNTLVSNTGSNTLVGSAESDNLVSNSGHDALKGGAGDDHYSIGALGSVITETADGGIDDVVASTASYTLDANVENLRYSGQGDFAGTGNALDNALYGSLGSDTLAGLEGDDSLWGQVGDDRLDGGGGNDRLDGGMGDDILKGGAGNDTLDGGIGSDTLQGGDGDDLLGAGSSASWVEGTTPGHDIVDGGAGTDTLQVAGNFADYTRSRPNAVDTVLVDGGTVENVTLRNVEYVQFADGFKTIAEVNAGAGTPGNDTLNGTDGNDLLDGGAGTDTLIGGKGDDRYVVDNANDRIVENAGEGVDSVSVAFTAAGTYVLAKNVENATVTAADNVAVNLTGNALANVLVGNGAANKLTGGSGRDAFVLNDTHAVDTVLDFRSGTDVIQIAQGGIAVGNGNTTVGYGVTRGAPGGFAAKSELVVFTQKIAGAITADSAAAAIGSATGAYADGATAIFAVNNGKDGAVFLFTSHGADAQVAAGELTELALLVGAPALATKDFVFVA